MKCCNTYVIVFPIYFKKLFLPGTTSGGTIKDIQETMTNSPVVR